MREQLKEQENVLHEINMTHINDIEKYLMGKRGNEKAAHTHHIMYCFEMHLTQNPIVKDE